VVGCCVGEPCGDSLARDDRSDAELCMDTSFGQPVSPRFSWCLRHVGRHDRTGVTHITLGQEAGAELHVVFQVE
jgi:hypothetical protein